MPEKAIKLTVKCKLLPDKQQASLLEQTTREYITTVNKTAQMMVDTKVTTYTSKDINAKLPSAVKNQAVRDAKSVYKRYKKTKKLPVLKKPMCIWNNQNYSIKDNQLSFPVFIDGKSKRISVRMLLSDYQLKLLENNLGSLRITKKSGKWVAQIAVSIDKKRANGSNTMGVDLGLKIPAVAETSNGKVKFFGNGRQNKYIRRHYQSLRKKLGKCKKLKKIKQVGDKEQRWMNDQDHKISRQIVNFAIDNNVSVIRMEKLANIRNTAKTSRKNEKNLHTWSFYRLAKYIEYKANKEGIVVEFVNPKHTSQRCPICGELNKARDRKYVCKSCGHKLHRDRVGAINIMKAPVIDGVANGSDSLSA
jgi:putative transposase